jgi:tetratricopeptide (TPR) repeat protein
VEAFILLGLCAAETDDPTRAENFYHQAIDLSREIDYPRGLVRALHNLSATVYVPRGQFSLALAADEESLHLAREHRLEDAVWFPLATMGWVYWTTGQWSLAASTARDLKQIAVPGSLAEGFACCLLADLAQEGETPETALPLYARARSIAESVGDPGLGVLGRLGVSRYHRRSGDCSASAHWADDALALAQRVGYHHLQGMACIERARAAWGNGDIPQAEGWFPGCVFRRHILRGYR